MRLALYLTSTVREGTLRDVVELATIAEAAGFDDVCIGDHVVMGGDPETRPPWRGAPASPTGRRSGSLSP